jgi:hypothetical protein
MLFNIGPGDTVRDTLVADRVGKPLEDRVIVMTADGFNKAVFLEGGPDVFDQILLTGDLTDAVDERCRESQSIPLRSCQAQTSRCVIRLKLKKCLNSHVKLRRIATGLWISPQLNPVHVCSDDLGLENLVLIRC